MTIKNGEVAPDETFVFISYRRVDGGSAGRLRDSLERSFGRHRVFQDVCSIPYGESFPEYLTTAVEKSEIVLAVIDRNWIGRLKKKESYPDWVVVEIGLALRQKHTKVIPVLIDDTKIPPADQLPDSIAELANLKAAKLSNDNWDSDINLIIRRISELGGHQFCHGVLGRSINNLPRSTIDFVGRDGEIHALKDWVTTNRGSLVVSIDGMPGVGKTEYALRAARELEPIYPDALLYLDLHGFSANQPRMDLRTAVESMLLLLGVSSESFPPKVEQQTALWRSLIAEKRILVILDNAAEPSIAEALLPGSSNSLTIITSRRRITTLTSTKCFTIVELDEVSALRLFKEILGFPLSDKEDVMRSVVHLCGYLPLAIRLAAGRLRRRPALGIDGLLRELKLSGSRLRALQGSDRGVYMAFEMSYRLLPLPQRRLFRCLSSHPGRDFDIHAVAALSALDTIICERYLESLIADNLVRESQDGRISLHDLIRDYASELNRRSKARDDRSTCERRLINWFFLKSEDVAQILNRRNEDLVENNCQKSEARNWLITEHHNFIALIGLAKQHQDSRISKLVNIIAPHLQVFGFSQDALRAYNFGLEAINSLEISETHATLMLGLAEVSRLTGQRKDADASYLAAQMLYRQLGLVDGEARVLFGLGELSRTSGDYSGAHDFYLKALNFFVKERSLEGTGGALIGLGEIEMASGNLSRAREYFGCALSLSNAKCIPQVAIFALRGLGELACNDEVHLEEAKSGLNRALSICRLIGYRRGEANILYGLAELAMADHQIHDAVTKYREARIVCEEIGNLRGMAYADIGLGEIAQADEEIDEARRRFAAAFHNGGLIEDRRCVANALIGLGLADRLGDKGSEMPLEWKKALHVLHEMGVNVPRTRLERILLSEIDSKEVLIKSNLA